MKTILKIAVGFVLLIAGIVALVFWLTSGLPTVASEFFDAAKAGQFTKAHGYLAQEFKAGTDEAKLKTLLTDKSLTKVKDTSWSSRKINNGRGWLSGSVTTDTGGTIPVNISFVKEDGQWKIYSLETAGAGVQTAGNAAPGLPDKAAQVRLVKQTMRDFGVSVRQKSMEHFRSTFSELWKKQIATEKLNEVFAQFLQGTFNLDELDGWEPVVEPEPSIDEDRVLRLQGRYPDVKQGLTFDQKYIYEGDGWKLVGFSCHIGKAASE